MDAILLAEAEEKYPKGTKFLSLFDFRVYTSTGSFVIAGEYLYSTASSIACVHHNGNWAAKLGDL